LKLASNYPTRQQAVVDGGWVFVVVAASKSGAAGAAFGGDRAQVLKRAQFQRTTVTSL